MSDRYRFFAEVEARGSSPLYEHLAGQIAEDDELLALIAPLEPAQQQPNLLFAAVNCLGGIDADYEVFRCFVLRHAEKLLEVMRTRTTQTNEIGRCATLLPVLGLIPGPLALIEVGASAGLNLLLDRFAYDYGAGRIVGDESSGVVLPCEIRGDVPIPASPPQVVWRRGIDLAPVDVTDPDAVRWLESCVFADQTDRLERLRAAVRLARGDPPKVIRGDLVEKIAAVVEVAPREATTVVFHSAVLNYLEPRKRRRFAELMPELGVTWLSNEAPTIVKSLDRTLKRPLPDELCYILGRNGTEPIAFTHPHGRWIEWIA